MMAKVLEVRDGVEVSVETGTGHIATLGDPAGKRNAKVEIKADHLDLLVACWVDTKGPLYDVVRAAFADGRRVDYRVVVKRKRNQPTDVPLDKVLGLNRIRDLEALTLAAGAAPSTPTTPPQAPPAGSPAPPTAPSPPPAATGPAAVASAACGLCDGPVNDNRPLRRVAGVLQHVECPAQGSTTPDDAPPPAPAPDVNHGPSTVTDGKRGPRVAEARPWEYYNSDGSLNVGSYAYGAAEGMVLLANDLLLARARTVATTEGGGFQPPTEGQVRSLARRLLRAADRAQATLRDDGHVSRMAASHSRSRAAVRAALDVYPVPWGQPDAYDPWELALAAHAGILLRLTVDLVDPEALP